MLISPLLGPTSDLCCVMLFCCRLFIINMFISCCRLFIVNMFFLQVLLAQLFVHKASERIQQAFDKLYDGKLPVNTFGTF